MNMYIVLGILAFMMISFLIGKWSYGLTSMVCIVLLVVTGQMSIEEAFSGFAMKNLILIAGIYIVSAAFAKTRFIGRIQSFFTRFQGRKSSVLLVAMLILLVALLSQFMSASVVITMVIMVMSTFSHDGVVTPSKMLLPLAFMASFWQEGLPVGQYFSYVSVFNQQIAAYNSPYLFNAMDMFKVVIIPLIICCIYVLFAYKWLPKRTIDESKLKKTKEVEAIPRAHEVLVYIVFILITLSMFLNPVIGDITFIIPAIGAIILVFAGALKEKEAKAVLNNDLLFMLAGIFIMANAVAASGAGEFIGNVILKALGSNPSGLTVMFAFGGVSLVLTQFMSNSGARNVLLPMALATCVAAGFDPRGVLCVVKLCCDCSVLLPTSSPSTAIAFSAGGYKLSETLKFSIPVMILCLVSVVISANIFFPVYG